MEIASKWWLSLEGADSPLVGHDAVFDFFNNAQRLGRLSSAYLFMGLPGIGKQRCASEVARGILCSNPTEGRGCGECASCSSFDRGENPNFVMVHFDRKQGGKRFVQRREGKAKVIEEQEVAAKTTPKGSAVDAARAFIEQVQSLGDRESPVLYAMPNFERYSVQVQNALLKTIEEPPRNVTYLLTTDRPAMVLNTIHSRCQAVNLQPLGEPELRKVLRDSELNTGEVEVIITLCDGRMDLVEKFQQEPYRKLMGWTEHIWLEPKDDFLGVAEQFMALARELELGEEAGEREIANEALPVVERILFQKILHLCRNHFVGMQAFNTTVEELLQLRRSIETSGHVMLGVESYFQTTLRRLKQLKRLAFTPEAI